MNELQEIRVHQVEIYRLQVAAHISLAAKKLEADALEKLLKESTKNLCVHIDSACHPSEHANFLLFQGQKE